LPLSDQEKANVGEKGVNTLEMWLGEESQVQLRFGRPENVHKAKTAQWMPDG